MRHNENKDRRRLGQFDTRRYWALAKALGCAAIMACEGVPTEREERLGLSGPVSAALPTGVTIDMGAERPQYAIDGFSPSERVGSRRSSWSEGDVSTVGFQVRGDSKEYVVAFLAQPYHVLGGLSVGLSLNDQQIASTTIERDWRAYKAVVRGDLLKAGPNTLAFRYSKTARPADMERDSNDYRQLGLRFDQIQVQPIASEVRLRLKTRDALSLASLGQGWARDPNDRGNGVWTLGERSELTFHIADIQPRPYVLSLMASALPGVTSRTVAVSLNGNPLSTLIFQDKRTTLSVEIPAGKLRGANDLVLEFDQLVSPAELNPKSKDARPLGLRVYQVAVAEK